MEGSSPEAQVRHAAMLALTSVRGQEAKTFAALSAFLKSDADRLAAIRALQRLPRSAWPAEQAPVLLDVLLASIRSIPVPDRTSPAALDSLEFAHALANLLPADQAKKARAELNELGVRVIRIGTIFEKMTFDKETIAVQAGKPVEFILDNSDLMPHNFVITQPGSLEEIGLISEANAQQPGFAERNFVPDSPKILLASKLLQPRDTQKLSFTAPAKAGVYPYVCTYPGHWRRMYGALYVVDDLDEYQADPEKYLAAHSLPSVDPLLQDRRPRTEWKLADLAPEAAKLAAARSYGNGKQMFKVASCVSCHKLDGQGQVFGPDLLKLDPKLTTGDILQSLLEPSAKIEEKYQSNVFELVSGKTLTGMVVEETKDTVKVIENPLLKAEPLVLKKSDIAERVKSPVSIMPKGLLDKLTRDEILDLVAYIASRGNKEHALFKGDPHEHHKHHKH